MAYIPIRVERLEREAAGMEREREREREGKRRRKDEDETRMDCEELKGWDKQRRWKISNIVILFFFFFFLHISWINFEMDQIKVCKCFARKKNMRSHLHF